LLLGAIDVSPFEVAQIYGGLANGGFRTPLRAVRSVVDNQGQPLVRYALELESAASPEAVQQLNQALIQVIERGTGRPAKMLLPANRILAGKTGTSDDYRDSWFAGFGSDYLAVVWVGRDDNQPIGLTGSTGALTVWAPIMAGIDRNGLFEPAYSSALKPVWIDYQSGLATRAGCGESSRVPLPSDVRLRRLQGCSGLSGIGSRALDWLDNIGNRP
jgi:penicillin-binding protein 1B